jgi:hypothetical protein
LRIARIIAAAWLMLLCALAPSHAEKRVALVVGNGAYRHADKLANPINDARGMRDALSELKFDVVYGEDLDGQALRRLIGQFAGRVDGADVALVYFAGHGATFGDAPYVVPVDATFSSLDEAPFELVAVETLIGELRRAKNVRIAILDACRDNAAEQALKRSRGGPPTRGLAPPKNPSGLIIAYATQHGATAADSAGARNSPFTAALLNNIAIMQGLDVKEMFFKVGRDVVAATRGRQRPEISVSFYDQYALVPADANPALATPPGGSQPVVTALPDATSGVSAAAAAPAAFAFRWPKPVHTVPISPDAGTKPAPPPPAPAPVPVVAAPAPPSAPVAPIVAPLDRDEINAMLVRAHTFLSAGDVAAARVVLRRAAASDDPQAALALGGTYDPAVLKKLGLNGFHADPAQAREWYRKAAAFGSADAAFRLEQLTNQ